MSNLKRAISMILVFAMLATSAVFTTAVFAEETTAPATSNIVLNDEDLVVAEKLAVFGIIDPVEDTATLKNYLTRGDMVDVMIRFMRMENAVDGADTTPFLDVSVFDERVGAYTALYKLGYIQGDENKNFRPNDLLTYNEAITLVISAMGYKMFAVRNGGYPGGYLYTANKCELLKDLRGNGNNPIPYCDLYSLLDASLLTNAVVERSFTSEGNASFAISEDVTVLQELHNIKVIRGVVTGNENTRLLSSDSSAIDRNQIRIENEIYNTPGREYAEYLGRRVIGYVKTNEWNDDEILFLELDKNDEFTIQAEDLIPGKTTQNRIYYEVTHGKEKFISVDSIHLAVIYNGKNRSGYGALSNVLPKSGYIVGVDNTLDGAVDVLFVYEFANYIVGSVDLSSYKVYDKYTNEPIRLDPYKDDVRIYGANGKTMDFEAIQRGDVISVMQSANPSGYKLITVYNERKMIVGTISEMVDNKYKIGEQYYEVAPNLATNIDNGAVSLLQLGLNATFYLDHAGEIANYERTGVTDAIYGFVAGKEIREGFEDVVAVKIFTQDGVWIEAETPQKVFVDGKTYSLRNAADLNSVYTAVPVGEIILFKTKEDKITHIDTVALNYGNADRDADVGNLNPVASGSEFETRDGICNEYSGDTTDLSQNTFVAKGDCVVFMVPEQENWLTKPEDFAVDTALRKAYYRASTTSASGQIMTEGYVVYNTGNTPINVASCIVLKGVLSANASSGGVSLSSRSAFSVVTRVTSAVDEEGEICKKLYVDQGGAETGYLMNNTVSYSMTRAGGANGTPVTFDEIGLEVGDVIQIGTDKYNKVSQINVVYRLDQTSALYENAWLTYPGSNISFSNNYGEGSAVANVAAVDATHNVLQYVYNDKKQIINIGNAMISIFKTSTKLGEIASAASLVKDDLVLIRTENGSTDAAQILVIR